MFHVKHKIVQNERPRPSLSVFGQTTKFHVKQLLLWSFYTTFSDFNSHAADFRIFLQKVFLFTDDFRRGDFVSYLIIAFRVFLSLITRVNYRVATNHWRLLN